MTEAEKAACIPPSLVDVIESIEADAKRLAAHAEEERAWKAERKAERLKFDPDYQDPEELRAAVLAAVNRKTSDYGKVRILVEILLGGMSVGELYTLFRFHLPNSSYRDQGGKFVDETQLTAIRDATR